MKLLTYILVLLAFSNICGQSNTEYNGIVSDFKYSPESISFIIRLPNSFDQIGLFDTENFDTNTADPCIFIDSNSDQNLKIIEVLSSNGVLKQTYSYTFDGDDFVDNDTDEIVLFQDVKIYIAADFETPGHFDKVYLPITDYEISERLIDEFSLIFEKTECFEEFKKKIKT